MMGEAPGLPDAPHDLPLQATSWPWGPCCSSASVMCGCSSSPTTRLTPSTWPPWALWPSAAQVGSGGGVAGVEGTLKEVSQAGW
jgi:hypothetical protein